MTEGQQSPRRWEWWAVGRGCTLGGGGSPGATIVSEHGGYFLRHFFGRLGFPRQQNHQQRIRRRTAIPNVTPNMINAVLAESPLEDAGGGADVVVEASTVAATGSQQSVLPRATSVTHVLPFSVIVRVI